MLALIVMVQVTKYGEKWQNSKWKNISKVYCHRLISLKFTNPNWSKIPDYSYRILIIGRFGYLYQPDIEKTFFIHKTSIWTQISIAN